MSAKLRAALARQITEIINKDTSPQHLSQLSNAFELRKTGQEPELHLPVIKTRTLFSKDTESVINGIVHGKYDDRLIKDVSINNQTSSAQKFVFTLQTNAFIRETLDVSNSRVCNSSSEQKRFVVEYSSPNIAKPFHVGHLRSTIIGNFIANLQKYLGNNVRRINYLGDWGTQFGLLNVGIDLIKLSDDEIQKDPIKSLFNAYVQANKRLETDPSIAERARKYFNDLENGQCTEDIVRWEKYRKYTVDELKNIYLRLGVEFDDYAWESQYSQKDIGNVLARLEDNGLLLDEIDGRKIVKVGSRRVPVIKSDGSTLYLARDIAALLDRYKRYEFDRIFYVVDNAQTDHFAACFHVAAKVDLNLEKRTEHVKFGRIRGMSTRQGNVVFLNDVLDEARDVMKLRQIQSPTTKVDVQISDNRVSDILGISAVIVNDLKQRRQRDYDFDWDRALQVNGDTGIKLQYTHCRLISLFQTISTQAATSPDPSLLTEPEAINLIVEIARFAEVLYRCEEQLEACILVNYLFSLSNAISRALKRLNVKNESSIEVQGQRVLLFVEAQKVLNSGMRILGLKPLDKM